MYARVIVAYDGSPGSLAARPTAALLAEGFGCRSELLHVRQPEVRPDLDPPADHVLKASSPAMGLIEAVRATDPPGLLCMSSRGRGALGELVFGSVAAEVIRSVQAPLVVVGPQSWPSQRRRWGRMLVGLDGSVAAASILPPVTLWARTLGLSVHLLHVTYPVGDPPIADPTLPEEARIVSAELARVADDLGAHGVDTTWSVVEDVDAVTGIVRQAAHRMVDVVALTTHGRTALARLVAGSVTLAAVQRCPVPLLIQRPPTLGRAGHHRTSGEVAASGDGPQEGLTG